MSVYDRAYKTSLSQIKKYGMAVTVTNATGSSYDPDTGEMIQTITTATARGLFTSRDVFDNYNERSIAKTMIEITDRQMIIDGSIDLKVNDTITADGDSYTITIAEPVKPATKLILWIINVRK
jgi:hypothetical protein